MLDILNVINTELSTILKLNYCFQEYTKPKITYPYLIGEYIEETGNIECANTKGTFILSIFTRDREENNKKVKGTRLELEKISENLKEHFKYFRKNINNSIVAIEYDYRQPVNTGDSEIKKIEIYLKCDKWKGE